MKMKIFFTVTFNVLLMATLSMSAYAQQDSPEGAIARLGKGDLRYIASSPDGRLLAMAVLSDILLYDTGNGKEVARLAGHTGVITRLSFSPDGQTLATASRADGVRLWDVETRTLRHTLSDARTPMSFSPDSKTLAAEDSRIFGSALGLWDVATGEPLQKIFQGGYNGSLNSVSFSGDGQTLAAAHKDAVCLYDVATGRSRHIVNPSATLDRWSGERISFSPDGRTFITFHPPQPFGTPGSALKVWDISTGTLRHTLEVEGGVDSVSFSADGQTLATASRVDGLRLWDVATGTFLRALEIPRTVNSILFSPDGQTLAGRSDRVVYLLDVADGTPRHTIEHTNPVWALFYSRDGQTLVTTSGGWGDETLRLWDVATGTPRHTIEGYTYNVTSVSFSADGQTLVSASDGAVRLWDVATGTLRDVFQHGGRLSVSMSPDGKIVASGSQSYRQVHLWDVATGSILRTLETSNFYDYYGDIHSVSFSPDGQIVASGDEGGNVRLWDVSEGTLRNTLEGHADDVNSVSFSPDGQTLASGSDDETVRLWDVSEGTLLRTLPIGAEVNSVSFSPDGKILANGNESQYWKENIHLWDVATGTFLRALEIPGTGSFSYANVDSVSFSPDGKTLASVSSDKVHLLDVATGTLLHTFEGHLAGVNSVSFSPDGKTLASASDDGQILLWSVGSPAPDVNHDDKVDILDLVLIAREFGKIGENEADVNGDGIVNIQDLVLVAGAFGEEAAAPLALSRNLKVVVSRAEAQKWLTQAQQLNRTDPTSLQGILFLEQLLAALTPKETALLPNYPNPFNPETWIPYQLATPADVSIVIYAVDGQLVRKLDLGHQAVGMYQHRSQAAHWDGKNGVGEPVASGLYFYTLKAGDFTATRKMLILK